MMNQYKLSLSHIMPNINLYKNTVYLWVTSLLMMFISYQLYQATTWGAGLLPDSITYIEGARSIFKNWNLDGIGTHYPPLYFILIALTALITGNTLEALRLLQLLTISLNFIVFTMIVWKGTQKALLPTILCSLFFVTSQSVLYIHAMAWSEGTFCFFSLLGFYFLGQYLEDKHNRFSTLTLSALFIGLAFITRYVGITLIVTGIISLALYSGGNKIQRLKDCFYFGFFSSFPMLLWMVRNWFVSGSVTSRKLVVHTISIEKVQAGLHVFFQWLFIPNNQPIIFLVVLILIAIIYIISIKDIATKQLNRTAEIYFIFILIYIPFILISISLFDAHTPLDKRILFPVYLFFGLGFVLLAERIYHIKKIRTVCYFMFLVLFILAYAQFSIQKEYLSYARTNGIGFASKKWIQSDMLHWVKKLPKDTVIYTNGPDVIKIIAHRSSKMVPSIFFPVNQTKNNNIQSDIYDMVSEISDHKGVIIYFNGITWRRYLPTIKQLSQVLPLKLEYRGKDGVAVEINSQIKK